MTIPHYAHLVLKIPGPRGVIFNKGDFKRAIDCDRESYETTDRLTASAELQDLKQALAESPPDPVMPEAKTSKMTIQLEDSLSKTISLSTETLPRSLTWAIVWTPNRNSRSSNS
jgi:hypothetical protein